MRPTGRPESRSKELPPPLPPETRTVGQLVAEALRFYGQHFWPSLVLGLGLAVLNQLTVSSSRIAQLVLSATVGAVLLSASYAAASALVGRVSVSARSFGTAVVVGTIAFAPAPLLVSAFVLPAVAWLALVGLAVPVAMIERTGIRASFTRAVVLARADYVHAAGSLATLAITYFLTKVVMLFLLRGQADLTLRAAAFLADLVISPLLFLGAAILYSDQHARWARKAA